jgi:hypothetical protein
VNFGMTAQRTAVSWQRQRCVIHSRPWKKDIATSMSDQLFFTSYGVSPTRSHFYPRPGTHSDRDGVTQLSNDKLTTKKCKHTLDVPSSVCKVRVDLSSRSACCWPRTTQSLWSVPQSPFPVVVYLFFPDSKRAANVTTIGTERSGS